MALVTTVALAWTVWLRFGGDAPVEPPTVGSAVPPLRLLDATTSQPIVLVGLRGRVVWITFWSSNAPAEFAQLERVWDRLGSRRGFSMVAAAVDAHAAERVRTLIGQAKTSLPVYLASPETCRTFGATAPNLPLHLLIDENGQVGAIAYGAGRDTFSRLADLAERWLDEREPLGKTRFATDDTKKNLKSSQVRSDAGFGSKASRRARRAAAARRGLGARTTAELTATRLAPASRTCSMFSS